MQKSTRLLGNIAMLFAGLILLAFLFDKTAGWFGFTPMALCAVLRPALILVQGVAVVLIMVGLLMSVMSGFKNEAGVALLVGGFGLVVLVMLLPHYLGVTTSCTGVS